MTKKATGATQKDIGRSAIIDGWSGHGKIIRVMGRTVEVNMPYGIVAADQDKIFLVS